MKKIEVKGSVNLLVTDVRLVLVDGQNRWLTCYDVADTHEMKVWDVNKEIREGHGIYVPGVDFLDLKKLYLPYEIYEELGISVNARSASKSIYLLSKSGYSKLSKRLGFKSVIVEDVLENYFSIVGKKNKGSYEEIFNSVIDNIEELKRCIQTSHVEKKETEPLVINVFNSFAEPRNYPFYPEVIQKLDALHKDNPHLTKKTLINSLLWDSLKRYTN